MKWFRIIGICLCIILSGCATYQPGHLEDATRGFNLISTADEVSAGFAYAQNIEAQTKLINDSQLQSYIDDLGQRIIRGSRRQDLTYRFRIVDTDDINACALPGGFVYINRGLISSCQNEAELAGVIAHEIGHVAAKHGARQMTQTLLINLGLTTLEGLTEKDKNQQLYLALSQLLVQGFAMNYSRSDDRQADDLAVETMYHLGYDPTMWIHMLERMERGHTSKFDLFSTHPNTMERVSNVHNTLSMNFTPKPYETDSPTFQQMKRRLQQSANHSSISPKPSSSQGMYGVWELTWDVGVPYKSILVMKGETGATRTTFFDQALGQTISIDQGMQFVINQEGMFLVGSNPQFSKTKKSYAAYSPDNFIVQQQHDGSFSIIKLCDQAGNCADVQSVFIRSNP